MRVRSAKRASGTVAGKEPVGRLAQGSATLTSIAYDKLRQDIISAAFEPGQKLRIQQLCVRYGLGLTAIREALNRLSRDGLVSQTDRRGFSVTPLSEAHLVELTKTRVWINEIALRESIAQGDQAWEEGLVLAYHRLSRVPRHVAGGNDPGYNPEWEKAHRVFHASLIAACGSRWVMGFCEQLFDAADCYRHLSRVSSLQRKEPRQDEHRLILNAALARDVDEAVRLMTRHVTKTADLVRERLVALSRESRKTAPRA